MGVIDSRALVTRHPLFQGLDDDVVARVAALGVTERKRAGETLFLKGDRGDALYGVLRGRVRISASAPSGREVTLNLMEPGDMFGEVALLDGGPRTADAVAETEADLLAIRRRDFMPYLEREPRLALHCLKVLCARLRRTSELVEDAAFLTLPGRLAKTLLALAGGGGPTAAGESLPGLRLSQRELGLMTGTTRESVNKHLQSWRRAGWIDLARGAVTIRDAEALRGVITAGMEGLE